jgi:hypothetical protein
MPLFGKKDSKKKEEAAAAAAAAAAAQASLDKKNKTPTVEDKYIMKDVLGT